ncbi:protein ASPARTIC PROTEASE IN GUARD CELL 2-like [Panicum miliaceum]|uniref:Protein ASPARTIC PROTEASE IN GUARD CELL 2-like n=1 Tax=Panicum miliaceum TaxID=4540 RepID=A0A3L6RA46_PANMI|nr:protein ASPARTIC PROTEASE IN GUARD CELL 2-like [Panicum miliaceum]
MAFRGNLLVLLVLAASAVATGKSARLELVPAAPGASMAERAMDDRHRHAYITQKIALGRGGSRRVAAEVGASAVSLPVSSGAYAGTGQYFVKYKEGSAGARGVVGTDSATIALPGGKMVQMQDVVLGCSSTHDGQSFQAADGVISLGNSKISFASRAAARYGGSFSYCLVDHLAPRDATGYLAFGPGPAPKDSTQAAQTQLLLDPKMPFYGVKVEAIHVAGKALDIPAEVWDATKNGSTILDSGTTLTVLATPAYKAVVAALSTHLAGVPTVAFPPFEHCYNWTARRPGAPEIPKLAVQFAGSAPAEARPQAQSAVAMPFSAPNGSPNTTTPPSTLAASTAIMHTPLWSDDVR